MVPKTHLSRAVGVIACVIGMLLVSLIVVSLTTITNFNEQERKAYNNIRLLKANDNILSKATKVILNILELRRASLKKVSENVNKNKLMERFVIFAILRKNTSILKNEYKISSQYIPPMDEMLTLMGNNVKIKVNGILENMQYIKSMQPQLDKIAEVQVHVIHKLYKIISRQESISNYLMKINNKKLKALMIKKFNGLIDKNKDSPGNKSRRSLNNNPSM
jgi:hypothetical protein